MKKLFLSTILSTLILLTLCFVYSNAMAIGITACCTSGNWSPTSDCATTWNSSYTFDMSETKVAKATIQYKDGNGNWISNRTLQKSATYNSNLRIDVTSTVSDNYDTRNKFFGSCTYVTASGYPNFYSHSGYEYEY